MSGEIHNHYHLWPKDEHGNCSCAVGAIFGVACLLVVILAHMDKLPW